MDYAVARLMEPSTWAGAGAVFATGAGMLPGVASWVCGALAAVCGSLAAYMKDHPHA